MAASKHSLARATQHLPNKDEPSRRYASHPDSVNADPIGDQALLIKALREARNEARAASNAKTAFLASVSHELRTPLNAILGFAEMIAGERLGEINEKRYASYANDISKGARQLLGILSDILDMARLESGRTPIQREVVALKDVVDEALATVRERAPLTLTLEVSIALQFPELWTDRSHLRQILVNLISNAIAFTAPDGVVVVSGHVSPGGELEIAVADNGAGMTVEEIKRSMTRFGHAEQEQSRKHQGIGLGLPLSKSLSKLLGGDLRVASTPGEGTVVTVSFPRESVQEQAFKWKSPPDRMGERARRLKIDESDELIHNRRCAEE